MSYRNGGVDQPVVSGIPTPEIPPSSRILTFPSIEGPEFCSEAIKLVSKIETYCIPFPNIFQVVSFFIYRKFLRQ